MTLRLRRSRFVHQLPVGEGRILIVHAVSHMRLPADAEVGTLLNYFSEFRNVPDDCAALTALIPYSEDALERAIKGLLDRHVLTAQTPDEELANVAADLAVHHGRDPQQNLEDYRRRKKEGVNPYWSVGSSYGLSDLGTKHQRVDVLLLGDCDIQMEADFLRREAALRHVDLHVAATFPDDVRFASEHAHQAIYIGALRARHDIVARPLGAHQPHDSFIAQAARLLTELRERSAAPILIDNLPEPTVEPLGFAEKGLAGHRTRFRLANVALAELAATFRDVYVIDIASALARGGAERLVDDGLMDFTHLGSPGWLLQRPLSEKAAVHNIFPDLEPMKVLLEGDPYLRERTSSRAHLDGLITVLGIDRKKCVIVDLDNTLWPGVLAETGSPFAWTPEVSGGFSYIGLYFGLHEALLCLKKRGILLAIVSKNDATIVRDLWKYPDHYPKDRMLTLDDFVTWRINWNDKVDNIRSIIDELGFAPETFLFIDDRDIERDRVHQRLPQVEVWGDDPFALRRRLLTDPRLQLPSITDEAASRSDLVKSQLQRQHLRSEGMSEDEYRASLNIECAVEKLRPDTGRLGRVEELFQRTTQFNTTGCKFTVGELLDLIQNKDASVFAMDVTDRFGKHGLVGAAVIVHDEILGLVMSCRVLGMGVEHRFMQSILDNSRGTSTRLTARLNETSRNFPVRNLYKDHGFSEQEPGFWSRPL